MSEISRRTPTPRRGIHDGPRSPNRFTTLSDDERSGSDSETENFVSFRTLDTSTGSQVPVHITEEELVTIKRKVTYSPTLKRQSQSRSPSRPAQQNKRWQHPPVRSQPNVRAENSSFPVSYIIFAVVFFIALAIYGVSITGSQSPHKYITCPQLNSLKDKIPHQEDYMWKSLRVGIEGVLNNDPTSPSVFLFIHQDTASTRKAINDIFKATGNCFDQNGKTASHQLDINDFIGNEVIVDYGVAVKKYKDALKNGGVLLIADINKIPAEAAPALHFICDTFTPIVDRAIIFLTLTSSELGKPVEVAESTLRKLWGDKIKPDDLDPLIVRITDEVLRVY